MRKVAVFGGAFDPPQNGHLEVLTALCTCGHFDQVLVIPCGSRADKPKMLPGYVRASLVERMIESLPVNIQPIAKLDRREIEGNGRMLASRTLMRDLRDNDPTTLFYLYVGSDLVEPSENEEWHGLCQITHSWQHGKVLYEESRFVVGKRPGYRNPHEFIRGDDEKFIILENNFCASSSSNVRDLIVQGKDLTDEVPALVAQEIITNNLYK